MNQKELEMKIIAHICTFEDDMQYLLSEGIDEDFFIYTENGREPIFRNLFISARNYYQQYNRLLSQETIENKIRQKDEDVSSNKILSLFMQVMTLDLDHNSFPTLIKDLKSKKMYTVIKDIMYTIDNSLKSDNPSVIFDKLKEKIMQTEADLIHSKQTGNKTCLLSESYNEIIDEYFDKKNNPDKYKGIEIGLSVIDNATNGFKPSTLNIVAGASGAGKSVILTNWAAEVYRRKHNILFFSLEMPLQQVIGRYIARELCLDYNRFYNGKLTVDEEELLVKKLPTILGNDVEKNGVIKSNNNSYFIILTNFDNPDVDYIEDMVRKYQKMYGKIDAIFIDYLNNMRSKEILKSGGPEWAHSGACAKGLRRIAAHYGLTVFTAQQINRSGLEKSRKSQEKDPSDFKADQEDMSGSQTAFHDADSWIAFNPDIDSYKMYFKRVKGRDFYFEPFSVNYYPTMNRIVDSNADDTTFMLSPLAARENTEYQLLTEEDEELFDDFGEL